MQLYKECYKFNADISITAEVVLAECADKKVEKAGQAKRLYSSLTYYRHKVRDIESNILPNGHISDMKTSEFYCKERSECECQNVQMSCVRL